MGQFKDIEPHMNHEDILDLDLNVLLVPVTRVLFWTSVALQTWFRWSLESMKAAESCVYSRDWHVTSMKILCACIYFPLWIQLPFEKVLRPCSIPGFACSFGHSLASLKGLLDVTCLGYFLQPQAECFLCIAVPC